MPSPRITTQTFLSRLPLFSDLAPAELDRIAAGTTELHVPRGEVIVNRGDPCLGFHLVVYGQVKLAIVTTQGGEKIVDLIAPGHSFGEAVMFMERPYYVMAQAVADSFVLHISRRVVFEEIERDPAFARKMLAGLSRRLHGLVTDVESYSLQSGAERLIGYLLRQDERLGGPSEGAQAGSNVPYVVTLTTSKAIIASRLNLTPEHLSRILHELATAGLISVEGRDIRILDVEKLGSYPR
jgi:CRP-like cAMP-binding protein